MTAPTRAQMAEALLASADAWDPEYDSTWDYRDEVDHILDALDGFFAEIWQDGRESIGRDMLRPMPDSGYTREAEENPYA